VIDGSATVQGARGISRDCDEAKKYDKGGSGCTRAAPPSKSFQVAEEATASSVAEAKGQSARFLKVYDD